MYRISSYFGSKEAFRNRSHSGIDFVMEKNTPLRSIKDGIVEAKFDLGNQNVGKCIKIRWEDGKTAIYGHLNKFESNLSEGDTIAKGDVIGYSGNSGHVVGANGGYHLHFGLKENGKFIDPSPYINDIQHMNDVNYFVQKIPEVTQVKVSFFDYMQQHMSGVSGTLVDMKLNFINSLTNDVVVIKILEQLFQFISGHASLLYHIVTCII